MAVKITWQASALKSDGKRLSFAFDSVQRFSAVVKKAREVAGHDAHLTLCAKINGVTEHEYRIGPFWEPTGLGREISEHADADIKRMLA